MHLPRKRDAILAEVSKYITTGITAKAIEYRFGIRWDEAESILWNLQGEGKIECGDCTFDGPGNSLMMKFRKARNENK
jgi:hypothetical protein